MGITLRLLLLLKKKYISLRFKIANCQQNICIVAKYKEKHQRQLLGPSALQENVLSKPSLMITQYFCWRHTNKLFSSEDRRSF